ncbi:MAG: hypothetical protein VW551_06080 [Euryarchaeota archaeon]|jgi:hypothetical protein
MRGLEEALAKMVSSEISRASSIDTSKEQCRVVKTSSGCKHNAKRNALLAEAMVDYESTSFADELDNTEVVMYHPTEVLQEFVDGAYLTDEGWYILELKADEIDEPYAY